MPSDLDICRSAAVLIEHHGDLALIEAGRQEDALLAKGNMDGARVWQAVGRAIRALQQTERPADKLLN